MSSLREPQVCPANCYVSSHADTPIQERQYPADVYSLATHIAFPSFPFLLRASPNDQLDGSDPEADADSEADILETLSPIPVFHSATATFHAPSDPPGLRGLRRERIRCTPSWRSTGPRRGCVFAVEKQDQHSFRGMSAVRTRLFFSFPYEGEEYPCAPVEWFKKASRSPAGQTGMWQVAPGDDGLTAVHLDSALRSAHLIPCFGSSFIPPRFRYQWPLGAFKTFLL